MSSPRRPGKKQTRHRKHATGDPQLGLRIRKARIKAGLSQERAAHQLDRSDRWLLDVENGRADPGYGDLVRLAQVFHVGLEQLVLDDADVNRPQRTNGATPRHAEVAEPPDAAMMGGDGLRSADERLAELRRRGFLRAGLVATGGVVIGLWPRFEDRAESPDMAALRRGLLRYDLEKMTEVPDLVTLRMAIHGARSDLQASRYSTVLRSMPSLLAEARGAAQEPVGAEHALSQGLLAQSYRLIFNLFRKFGHCDLATIAADRGMQAAHASGDPALVADLAGCLCVMLSDGRHFDQAIDLCHATTADLKPDARHDDPTSLSIYGQLLLAGAEAAAQARDQHVSDELYAEATAAAKRLGTDANHGFTAFGPTNITVHRVHAAVILGDGERAVRLAKDMDVTRLPVLERRAHHLMDVAMAYGLIEKPQLAVDTLVEAERIGPEEVRLDPGARALVEELRRHHSRYHSQLDSLARRMPI